MIRGFYELDLKKKEIVSDTLKEWCVPFKVIIVKQSSLFHAAQYEIYVDLNEKSWKFIREKVDKALIFYETLESNFRLPSYEKSETTRKTLTERFNKTTSIGEVTALMDKVPKNLTKTEDIKQYLIDSGIGQEIRDSLYNTMFGEIIIKYLKNILGGDDGIIFYHDLPFQLQEHLLHKYKLTSEQLENSTIHVSINGNILKMEISI